MREIDIFYLKDHLLEINNIEKGDILLTKRNKPYAIILPYRYYLELSGTKKLDQLDQEEKLNILKRLKQSLNLEVNNV